MGRTIAAFLWLLALLAPAVDARAHPHLRIDAELVFDFRAARIATIRMVWRFDEHASDPHATEADLRELAGRMDGPLQDAQYFTMIEADGRRMPVTRVENLRVTLEQRRYVYRFDIPLDPVLDPVAGPVAVLIHDPSTYADIVPPAAGKVAFTGERPAHCRASRRGDAAVVLANGSHPLQVVVRCRA